MASERGAPPAEENLTLAEFWASLQSHFAAFLSPPPGGTALEIGCGENGLIQAWSERCAAVIGVDDSPERLADAASRAREAGLERVSFQAASPQALPFRDACFDLVSAFCVLLRAGEPARVVAEIARVTRVGGMFGLVVPSCRMSPERIRGFIADHRADASLFQLLADIHALRPGGFAERALERLLQASGLRSVRTIEQADGMLLIVKGWR